MRGVAGTADSDIVRGRAWHTQGGKSAMIGCTERGAVTLRRANSKFDWLTNEPRSGDTT